MKKIKEIADKHNLRIVEDAAHCIEGERAGIKPGHLGDVACFSFYATKNITSGEGGAIATNNKEIADRVRLLRQHGMSKEAADRYSGVYKHWDMVECGWKYNMDNIQASLLLPQLKKIDDQWQRREKVYNRYISHLSKISQIDYPKIKSDFKSAYHLFTIWVEPERRDEILRLLGEKGIGVAVNYRSIHLLTYFRETFGFKRGNIPVAESIGDKTISIPFYPQLSDEEVEFVAEALREII